MPQSRVIIRRTFDRSVLALWAILLMACSDGSDTARLESAISPETLLPATSRGFLAVDLADENRGSELRRQLASDVTPWRQQPIDIIVQLDTGVGLVEYANQLLLVQPTLAGDEFALLATVAAAQGEALFQTLSLTAAEGYQGQETWLIDATGLTLSRPDAQTWVVGPRISVERILDVDAGEAPGIEQSLLAPYLVENAEQRPVSFAYALPALYGEVATPGTGEVSLNQAVVVRGFMDISGAVLDGAIEFVAPNATSYTARLLELLPEGSPDVFSVTGDVLSINVTGMSMDDLRPLLKSMYPGMNAVDYAEAVMQGGNPPWLNFDVGQNPNSIFINFQFKDAAARAAFEAEHLPQGFSLAPLRILEADEPRYYLVLNIYQASGRLVQGARAEWSVFINDPETGVPRFLVVQAAAENFSADSVNLLTPPEPVRHEQAPDAIVSYVGVVDEETEEESTYFASRIDWPLDSTTYFAREFVVANDYIFWGNAVADRGMYNGSVHARPATLVSDSHIMFEDNSPWAAYLDPEPVHTVVYHNPLEIVISPWWNLDADYLDVTEEYRQELIDFKNGFYPGLVLLAAEAAMLGEQPALTTTMLGLGVCPSSSCGPELNNGVQSSYFHFTIRDAEALLDYLGVAGEFMPIAIPYYEDEAPQMYLTLALYEREDDPCDTRAEWQMTVQNEQGRASILRLEALSADACLDPVSLLGLPAAISQRYDQGPGNTFQTWQTQMHSAFSVVDIAGQYDNLAPDEVLPSQTWIAAGDEPCSLNGVCDANFYDGMTLSQPLWRLAGETIEVRELETPFDDFIDPVPVELTVRPRPAILGTNPWVTVPVFGTQ